MDPVLCKDHMLWTPNGPRNQTQSILEFRCLGLELVSRLGLGLELGYLGLELGVVRVSVSVLGSRVRLSCLVSRVRIRVSRVRIRGG